MPLGPPDESGQALKGKSHHACSKCFPKSLQRSEKQYPGFAGLVIISGMFLK